MRVRVRVLRRRSVVVTALAAICLLAVPASGWSDGQAPRRVIPGSDVPKQDVSRLATLALSPAQSNTLFVPISPCRIVDTRHGGGHLSSGGTRSFVVNGSSGFAAQGGRATGCGIPASATSISASIVAISTNGGGFLTAWAAGTTKPTASVLNYTTGTTNTGATLTVTSGTSPSLSVYASHGPVQIVIDVSGYYLPQMHAMIAPGNATSAPVYAGSSRVVSATNPSAGVYQVKFDGNITYCTPIVDTYNAGSGIYGAAYAFSSDTATVYTWYLNSTTHLEVPYSFYVYVTVIC